jgi:hypothetical protein
LSSHAYDCSPSQQSQQSTCGESSSGGPDDELLLGEGLLLLEGDGLLLDGDGLLLLDGEGLLDEDGSSLPLLDEGGKPLLSLLPLLLEEGIDFREYYRFEGDGRGWIQTLLGQLRIQAETQD